MQSIDLPTIKTPQELFLYVRKDLEGKTLREVAESIVGSDGIERLRSKAGVGHFIEEEYFGLKRNSTAAPDIAHLEVEIKTSALKRGKDGKLRVKEPLSLNIINYVDEAGKHHLRESSMYKKNKFILFIWYIHDSGPRSEYKIHYVFLWHMDKTVLEDLNPDYLLILEKIREGKAHQIHQSDHHWLTLCPKHGGTFKDPTDKKSKTKQIGTIPAEIRAFRLKNSYMNRTIYMYLAQNQPARLSEFVTPKEFRPIHAV